MPLSFTPGGSQLFHEVNSTPPLILEIDTSASSGLTYQINFSGTGTPSFSIEWGDGTAQHFTTFGVKTKTYSASGVYQIKVRGKFNAGACIGPNEISSLNSNYKKLKRVIKWGNIPGWTSLKGFCYNSSVYSVPNSLPSQFTNLSGMFCRCITFDQDISLWDTSNVIDMSHMFDYAEQFMQPIGTWNTGNVTDMSFMFANAINFNQPIGTWNTSNVTNMSAMFSNSIWFNDDSIGNWNTNNVTTMQGMFQYARHFNQPIGTWNTSNVTDMGWMFDGAWEFNQNIGSWNTGKVTMMNSMFESAYFFNQPIGTWNTSAVTNMSYALNGAASFNQPLGDLELNSVTNMTNMIAGTAISPENYSRTLISWANKVFQGVYPKSRTFGAGTVKYSKNYSIIGIGFTSGQSARNYLTNTIANGGGGWTITDGGMSSVA
jgi:surface protein